MGSRNNTHTHVDSYQLENVEENSQFFLDFFKLAREVPELDKMYSWASIKLWALKRLCDDKGVNYLIEQTIENEGQVYACIKNNQEVVGGIILSEKCGPRDAIFSRIQKTRTQAFDDILKQGYKYASYGFVCESEKGKTSLKQILQGLDEKFFMVSHRKGIRKVLTTSGGEEITDSNGTTITHMIFKDRSFVKYDPNNNPKNSR
ncbi:hypothetical protein OAN96_00350 [Candidatus Gracilibacteria bacterium]|nr:hypothetical protein [Candidatus Gracilibacteria bacterium]